jgi:selenocysteine lyase/cysteine desulfurase
VNFKKEGFDFLAFSGHKMLGPTGTGCLVAKYSLLEEMPPFLVGGETIERVTLTGTTFAKPPQKFEAGLQHYAGMIGLGAAVDYLKKIGMKNIEQHEKELTKQLMEGLQSISNIHTYGPPADKRAAIITFNAKGAKSPHDVAIMLDELKDIAVRSGVFCAEPAMTHLGAPQGAVRASLYLYNTKEEVEVFLDTLKKITSMYR